MSGLNVNKIKDISKLFKEKVMELQEEPEFQWSGERITYSLDRNHNPDVKVAIGNIPLDYDLWKGLRNPAQIGLYPAGIKELWNFHANRRVKRVDEAGRQTIFQVPRTYDYAKKKFGRALIISVMLPFSRKIMSDYTELFLSKGAGSSHLFNRMYEDIGLMLDKATSRVSIDLVNDRNVVISMDNRNVDHVSNEAISATRQGNSHGPSKGGNYPQKSLAVLMGLGQFGVSRLMFRDEINNGKVERSIGPIRSIVVLDEEEVSTNGSGGIMFPTDEWRNFLFQLYDFTNVDPEINKHRFCAYSPLGDGGCGECIKSCPSKALLNSSPLANGKYSPEVSGQSHRFWNDKLQFDNGRCCEDRGQMAGLYPEWSCAACATVCAVKGKRRKNSVTSFYQEMERLTKN